MTQNSQANAPAVNTLKDDFKSVGAGLLGIVKRSFADRTRMLISASTLTTLGFLGNYAARYTDTDNQEYDQNVVIGFCNDAIKGLEDATVEIHSRCVDALTGKGVYSPLSVSESTADEKCEKLGVDMVKLFADKVPIGADITDTRTLSSKELRAIANVVEYCEREITPQQAAPTSASTTAASTNPAQ